MSLRIQHLPFALLLLAAMPAGADVMYQCIDESGNKSFSNIRPAGKGAKCTAMNLGEPARVPGAGAAAPKAAATPTPPSFPKVDDSTQKARDTDRRRILEGELAAEERNLEQARKELADQEAVRSGDERNYQRVLDRLQPYKDKVGLHERNIEAIQKELSKLR